LGGCAGEAIAKISGEMDLLDVGEVPFWVGTEIDAIHFQSVGQEQVGGKRRSGYSALLKQVA
jgi:hypothetical protein